MLPTTTSALGWILVNIDFQQFSVFISVVTRTVIFCLGSGIFQTIWGDALLFYFLSALFSSCVPSLSASKAVKYFSNIRNIIVQHHHLHPSRAMMHHKVWKKVIMIHIMGQWEISETSPENVEWNFINLKNTRHQNFKFILIKRTRLWT